MWIFACKYILKHYYRLLMWSSCNNVKGYQRNSFSPKSLLPPCRETCVRFYFYEEALLLLDGAIFTFSNRAFVDQMNTKTVEISKFLLWNTFFLIVSSHFAVIAKISIKQSKFKKVVLDCWFSYLSKKKVFNKINVYPWAGIVSGL